MSQLETELRQIVSTVGEIPTGFPGNADFYRDLHLASFKSVDLLMALEERYKVTIPDDQYIEATTLQSLTAMMRGLLEN